MYSMMIGLRTTSGSLSLSQVVIIAMRTLVEREVTRQCLNACYIDKLLNLCMDWANIVKFLVLGTRRVDGVLDHD